MSGRAPLAAYRWVLIAKLVTLAHALLLVWAMSWKFGQIPAVSSNDIEIEFADIVPAPKLDSEPEASSLDVQALSEEPLRRAPAPRSEPIAQTAVDPPVTPSFDAIDAPATEIPSVLTANSKLDLITPRTFTGAPGSLPETRNDQVAKVLQSLGCQKLAHKKDEKCQEKNAFEAADAATSRLIVERVDKSDPDYRSKSVIDKFYQREVAGRLHWPDPDLFAAPLPPGAYDAQRIRNGQEPLWSKEMRDGFRKQD